MQYEPLHCSRYPVSIERYGVIDRWCLKCILKFSKGGSLLIGGIPDTLKLSCRQFLQLAAHHQHHCKRRKAPTASQEPA